MERKIWERNFFFGGGGAGVGFSIIHDVLDQNKFFKRVL